MDFGFEVTDVPPLSRIWFIRDDDAAVIQVQRDRFLHNWRKTNERNYPRYGAVKSMFQQQFQVFQTFLAETKLGVVKVRQCEMTYINQIPQGEGWSSTEEAFSLFPDFAWRFPAERFLQCPTDFNWKLTFPLPDAQGRLHVSVRKGGRQPNNHPIMVLELTARGFPVEATVDGLWGWFDMARETIVRGFADLTSPTIQSDIWKRTQ